MPKRTSKTSIGQTSGIDLANLGNFIAAMLNERGVSQVACKRDPDGTFTVTPS